MSLLDGKFEVFRQQQADGHCTVFEAAAPDGTPLRIEWYDLPPEQEDVFERYRRTVKRLKRTGRTAVHDVTSRPGARYVAWERPSDHAPPGRDPELEALLGAEGYTHDDALLLRENGETRLFGLAFDSGGGSFRAPPAATPVPEERRSDRARVIWDRLSPAARSWSLAGLLALFALALAVVGFERHTTDRIVAIPELLGMEVNAAAARLASAGFGVEVTPSSSDAELGTVVSMEPAPGTALRPGRTVRLSYALPAGRLPPRDVPRLVGEIFPDGVVARLEGAGLRLGAVARIAADVPRGAVIAQSAEPGSALGQGDAVDVLVSDGPREERTFVPDLVGLDVEDARFLAGVAGIPPDRVEVDEVPSAGRLGVVLSQSLAPHRAVPQDEAILRLIVGGGGAAATAASVTPSYVGMDRQEALAAVGGSDVEFLEISTLSLPQGVVEQDPDPGSERSDRVRLTLNLHPVPIPVPDVAAGVRAPEPREVPFAWTIEPGIPEVTATVWATTLEGERMLVHSERVAGGERVQGTWRTTYPGVVTFHLELNREPYSTPLRAP